MRGTKDRCMILDGWEITVPLISYPGSGIQSIIWEILMPPQLEPKFEHRSSTHHALPAKFVSCLVSGKIWTLDVIAI